MSTAWCGLWTGSHWTSRSSGKRARSAHSLEQRAILSQHAIRSRRIGLQPAITPLVAAAQQDPVVARKHVNVAGSDGHVLDFGLRQQERELATNRRQLRIVEQRA